MIHLLGRIKDESEIAGLRYRESLPTAYCRDSKARASHRLMSGRNIVVFQKFREALGG